MLNSKLMMIICFALLGGQQGITGIQQKPILGGFMSAQDQQNGRLPPGIWGPVDEHKKEPTNQSPSPTHLAGEVYLVQTGEASLSNARLLTRFENVSLQKTYEAVGVDQQRWEEWELTKKTGASDPLSEKYPMLSKLAWWFVEPVRFSPTDVKQLHQELEDVQKSSADVEVRKFTTAMLSATQEAIDTGQPLGVYP